MKEIISKRRTHSKTFDLGGRKRKVRVSRAPLHYLRDGRLVDIDTTPRLAGKLLEVSEAPYRLKIDPERPAYLYTTETGRQVEVELIEVGGQPVNARSAQEAGTVRWRGVAPQTDAAFRPLRKGIEALVVLYGPDAPRTWKWRVRGDQDLLLPPKGKDAKGQSLELTHSYDGDVLTIVWTGRATSRRILRRKEGATEDIAWPVVIDPTVNESIGAGADDVFSVWIGGNQANFYSTFTYVAAGTQYVTRSITLSGFAGLRFQTVAVPQGAVLSSATLAIDIIQINGAPNVDIYADVTDDAPAWANSVGNRVFDISRTTATKNIAPTALGPYPIGITAIVQEIVGRSGWQSGNDLRLGFFPAASTGLVVFAAFEHTTRTEAQLEIEYEEAAAAIVAPKMMHYRRLRI